MAHQEEEHELLVASEDDGAWEQQIRYFFSSGFLDHGLLNAKVIDILAGTTMEDHESHTKQAVFPLSLARYLDTIRVVGQAIDTTSTQDITPGSTSSLILVRGSPCYTCIRQIGVSWKLSPACLLDHLNMQGTFKVSVPPDTTWPNVTVRFASLGVSAPTNPGTIEALQYQMHKDTASYSAELLHGLVPGVEQCRRVNIHDKHMFSVEQEICLLVRPTSHSSWSGILFYDSGTANGKAPWEELRGGSSHVQFFPLVRHGHCALDKIRFPGPYRDERDIRDFNRPDPCTSRAHNDERTLSSAEKTAACKDPLVIVCDLFATSILSWLRLFSAVRALHDAKFDSGDNMASLLNDKATVDRSRQYMRDMASFLKSSGDLGWPKASEEDGIIVGALVRRVESELVFLLEESVSLANLLEGLIQLEIHADSKKETRAALAQGEQVQWLTILGYGFLPASLISSCFGMNVAELQNNPPIRTFFAVALPLTAACLLLLKIGQIIRFLHSCLLWARA